MAEIPIVNPTTTFQEFLNRIDQDLTNIIPDPGDAGTIDVSASGTLLLTHTTGSGTRTLPAPNHLGQKIDVCLDVFSSGDVSVLELTNGYDPGGTNTALVFDAAGESARLIGMSEGGTLVWRVLRADEAEPTLT